MKMTVINSSIAELVSADLTRLIMQKYFYEKLSDNNLMITDLV